MATVTSLGFSIFSTYSGRGVNQARRDLRRLETATERINHLNRAISDVGTNALRAGMLAAIPVATRLGEAALFVSGQLVSMSAAAGAAGAAYVGTMVAASKRAFELFRAGKKLNKNQREHVQAVHAMKRAWNAFLDSKTGSKTLVPLNIAIRSITRNMHKLKPLVEAMHPIFVRMSRAFASWMDRSSGLKRFINVIKKHGVPAFNNLQKAARHTLAALGIGFRQFLPHGRRLSKVILQGAKNLHLWAKQGGFQRFIKTARKHMPEIKALFRALGPAVMQVLRAMGGLGTPALKLATAFAQIIAHTPVPVLQAVLVALFALRVALAVAGAIKVLSTAFSVLRGAALAMNATLLASPWFWVAAAVAGVAVGLYFLATRTRFFQRVWHGMAVATRVAMAGMRAAFNGVIAAFRFMGRVIRKVWAAGIRVTWRLMRAGGRLLGRVLSATWRALRAAWKFLGRVIGKTFRSGIRVTWKAMRAAGRFLGRVLSGTWRALRAAWKFLGRVIGKTFRAGIRVTWKAMRAAARFLGRVLSATWRALRAAWRLLGRVIGRVFRAGIRVTWLAMRKAARGLRNLALTLWSSMRAAWRFLGRVIRAVWRNVIRKAFNGLKAGLRAVKSAFDWAVKNIRKAWDRLKKIVARPVKFFIDVVYNKGLRSAWNKTVGKLPGIGNLAKAKIPFARGGLVRGPGGPTSDKVPAVLSNGEFVVRSAAVKKIGIQTLKDINNTGSTSTAKNHSRYPGSMRKGQGHADNFALGGLVLPKIDIGSIAVGAIKKMIGIAKGSDFLSGGGGFLDDIKDLVKKVPVVGGPIASAIEAAAKAFDWVTNFYQDIAKKAGKALLNPFIGVAEKMPTKFFPGAKEFAETPGALLKKYLDALLEIIFNGANIGSDGCFTPFRAWKAGDGARVRKGGVTLNRRTAIMATKAEKTFGRKFNYFQGSWSHAGASAGTHAGGGAMDTGPTNEKAVSALRGAGFAAWARGRGWGSPSFSEHVHSIAVGDRQMSGAARGQVSAFFKGKDGLAGGRKDNFKGCAGGKGGCGVGRWRGLAMRAMRMGGLNPGKIGRFLSLMRQESCGNPRAQNNWDSNARSGNASRGLMQVIPSTFRANHVRGTSHNIFDPLANMAAAARYIRRRYGGRVPNAPYAHGGLVSQRAVRTMAMGGSAGGSCGSGCDSCPAKSMRPFACGGCVGNSGGAGNRGGGASAGKIMTAPSSHLRGRVPLFDSGGVLGPGLNIVNNATGHPEDVRPVGKGDAVHLHIHGNVYTKSSKEFEDMVVETMANARRKGRR